MWLNVDGLSAALGRDRGPAHDGRRRGDDGDRASCCSGSRPRTIRSAGAAAASAPALLAIAVFGSLALPVAARGPGVPVTRGAAVTPPVAARARPVAGPARRDAAARRRVARLRLAARRRRPPAELRAAARDAARRWTSRRCGRRRRIRSGRRSRPACIRRRTACARRRAYYVRGDTRPLALLPDHCFSHALVHLGLAAARAELVRVARASRPLWSILADAGIAVGVVRWPLTYPAQPVRGFVAERSLPRAARIDARARRQRRVSRRGAADRARRVRRRAGDGRVAACGSAGRRAGIARGVRRLARRFYSRAMRELRARWPVQFTALRYQGLDTVGHYNLRYTQPREFGGRERGGAPPAPAGDRPLLWLHRRRDRRRRSAALAPGDLLLVVSGFGMQPPNAVKRLRRAAARRSDERHARARARRLSARLRHAPSSPAAASAARSSTSRRRCSISSACRSAATWTATPAPICSRATFTAGAADRVHSDA